MDFRDVIVSGAGTFRYDASDLLSKVIFYGLFLIVLQMAFGVFGTNPVSDLLKGVIAYLPKVIAAVLIIVVATAIAAAVRELLTVSLGGLSYGKTLASSAATAIIGVGIFAALNQLQIAPAIVDALFYAILIAITGVIVVAVGGGGIKAMQERWTNVLAKYDEEKTKISQQMDSAKTADRRPRRRAQVECDCRNDRFLRWSALPGTVFATRFRATPRSSRR